MAAFPATHSTLTGFLIWYKDKNDGSTRNLDHVKSALWNFSKELGLPWLSEQEEHRCRKLIKMLKYNDVRPANAKAPLTVDFLNSIHAELHSSEANIPLLAAMFLGHDALLRSAELLSLRRADINVINQKQICITLRRTKTHRVGAAQSVFVSDRQGPSAFKLIRILLSGNTSQSPDTPLLGEGRARNWLASGIKKAVSKQGLDPALYSTHSLRAGGATDLLRAGTPLEIIRKAGRWRSDEVLKYLRDEVFLANQCADAFASLYTR